MSSAAQRLDTTILEELQAELDRERQASQEARAEANVQRRRASCFEGIVNAVSSSSNIEQLLERVLRVFLEDVQARVGVVRLREGKKLRSRAAVGVDGEVENGFSISVDEAFEQLPPTSQAVEVVESGPDPLRGAQPTPDVVAALRLALMNGKDLVGAIWLGLPQQRELSADDRQVLGALCAQATTAVVEQITRESLEHAVRSRDEILGIVAHDLRNPLNVISAAANSLHHRLSDSVSRRPLERIMRAAQRAEHLIRDLLDLSAIEGGHFSIDKRPIDTASTILSALDSQQGLAAASCVILASDLSPALPWVDADEERILEVLENLVGNAVKFTMASGTVTVGAALREEQLVIWVKDNGPGIAADQLTHLFDRFWQANKTDRRGTGLGLTICKAIVEAHGGRIWAESEPGDGTTVFFTIPAQARAPQPTETQVANILMVDDRPENLLSLRAILERPDYRLVSASSGEEALSLALRESFAVALLDISMPGMDGLEVAIHMKELERSRDIPIIFITAFGDDPEEIHRAYSAGGADYLVKPLDAEIVRKKVAVFVDLSRRRDDRQRLKAAEAQGLTMATSPTIGNGNGDGLPPSTLTADDELREILRVLSAVREGNFNERLPAHWGGLVGKIADTVNDVIGANQSMASQLERVGQVVGKEGKTRQRVRFTQPAGAWAEMESSVNTLMEDLIWPTTEVTRALAAVAQGDLTQTMRLDVEGRPLQGEFLRSATIVNSMIKQLGVFTSEVTRVSREVGTDGKLGGQAEVPDVSGVWKDLTESVNSMASNLTGQVRNISEVTIAVASGDLSKKITVDVRGEILQLKEAMNSMVDQLRGFASEVTRVAREVGTDGKLGGQAIVPGVAGTWKDLTDSVNAMCGNLTDQVRNIAQVTTAVARGDLSRKITVDVRGEILELKDTMNTMVDQLNSFASEVTRVAREVGTDGKLGGQAQVPGVAGTWKDLTDNVNFMASNLTGQVRNIAEVATAIAGGDLSRKITVNVSGEILQLKETINTMVDQLNAFAGEVTRVAREVGTEGRLGGQAQVPGVAGTWKDLTDSVNSMANNLTAQVRNIAEVSTAIANGDLSKKITVDVSGEILQLKQTINTMVDQLNAFAGEVTRVAREVGTEGKLGGQAVVRGVAGTWKDLTDSVNSMASNLTGQVRNIAEVATAVALGDLSRKITVDVRGEILQLKETINTMVDQLNAFAAEVTRVAREVGTEGKLGGQAEVGGVAGTWKDLTDSVNSMAGNLTGQVRNIAEVATAIAGGDLSRKITVDVRGEILQLKETINTMVDQLNAFAGEVTRVAREVGTDGRLGGQAQVPGVAGTWKSLTDSVNFMAGNLTAQVRNIAEVTTAVAKGDLSRKITVDVKGEILELKITINTMVDQLNAFASEVTRVAREVGTEGKLGGQAEVPGVAGTWKDLTDNVNSMATNLTNQVRNIAEVATSIASGDLSKKITVDVRGELLVLKETLNTMVEQLRSFAGEVTRVAREVGTEGRLGGQANVPGAAGTWKDLTDNVNLLAGNLTTQVRNIAEVTTAVASGDLSRKISVDAKGEILELKNTVNTMVDQLNAFANEVTRVAREVGTEGKLGGQAQVPGVGGTWKDLTDTVNVMGANLTEQVRGIAKVVTAVANGDLKQNFTIKSKGEVAALADTINNMTSTLATFAEQVTTVAREVGVEGRLGGQANVPGAAGTWKDLTGNVNMLAANLTGQVRAIAEVATAVTKGDLTRSVQVEARGEVAELKDNINTMIDNLRLTTQTNTEQDWLKTNLARFTSMLQGQRDLVRVGQMLLSELAPLVGAHQGVLYQRSDEPGSESTLRLLAAYADDGKEGHAHSLKLGEGLVGQCAIERRRLLITELPPNTIRVGSGLFSALPRNVIVLPVLFEEQVKAVIELASLSSYTPSHLAFLDQLTSSIGIVLNSIEATMQTEGLLEQSQKLATELQTQQKELQQTNDQLGQKAQQLAEQNAEVERKNQQIEQARRALEEKAEELALTSKYKSEFLANMSHELRTPLNSILILGQQLSDNPEQNLSPKQVEFARTIHSAGTDLLNLISDILDLSKIESGTVAVEPAEVFFSTMLETVARPFRHDADARGLTFDVQLDSRLGRSLTTDPKRVQQVLKNLLSNAFKFTEHGGVRLNVAAVSTGFASEHPVLSQAATVVAFEVSDTGIGIAPEKQKIIFEAFQQADAGTSRKYGGTGLGLAISRELSNLLGGEIQLRSQPGTGSTFTLYLPLRYVGPTANWREMRAQHEPPSLAAATAVLRVADATPEQVPDDRADLHPGDSSLLIVEDDPHYARVLVDLARDRGFKVLVAHRGTEALDLAREFHPSAISLDVFLPDMLGWTVLSHFKQDPTLRHIPVQIVTLDDNRQHGLSRGAFSFITKPATTEGLEAAFTRIKDYAEARRKRLLIVEDNHAEMLSIKELLGHDDIDVVTASNGAEALQVLKREPIDCMVLDLRLPDISGLEVLAQVQGELDLPDLPVVVFTGKDLSPEQEGQLQELARKVVIKGVESPERLLDETALFLHRVIGDLPPHKQQMLERLHRSDEDLRDRKVLVVDDDVRNIFALGSVLERHGMKVITAQTGQEAIDTLEADREIAIVLMDIMMPEMDGYQTIALIRKGRDFRRLPIVALTAKAMKGDREKCLDAGASDYLAKPVNTDQLLATLRMWLHR